MPQELDANKKARKDQKNKNSIDDDRFFQTEGSLADDEELDIKSLSTSSEVPDDIYFPEELNRYFREQIRNLTNENGCLRRYLEEKEEELRKCTQNADAMRVRSMVGRASDLAASKIVELTKKIRHLTAEVESERYKTKVLEKKLADSEEKDNEEAVPQTPEKESANTENKNHELEIRNLGEKLSSANRKLFDSRNECQKLKQELKVAQKALASEIGEGVTVQEILSNPGSWRGRSQQIFTLQQKVAELQEKLKQINSTRENSEEKSKTSMSTSGSDNRMSVTLRQMEREKRAAQQQMVQQIEEMKMQLDENRKKLDGSKLRCRTLEADVSNLKSRIANLLEKGKHDDEYINVLNKQLKNVQDELKDKKQEHETLTRAWEEERNQTQQEIVREKSLNSQLKNLIIERDSKIEKLEQKIRGSKLSKDSEHNLSETMPESSSVCGQSKNTDLKYASQEEISLKCMELQAIAQAGEAERIRLLELHTVLNRRLDEQRNQATELQEILRKERRKSARLETKLGKLLLERSKGRPYSYQRQNETERDSVSEELQDKLELLEEEALTLRTRLCCMQHERDEDLRSFNNILEETRRTFHESLHKLSKKPHTCTEMEKPFLSLARKSFSTNSV